MGLLKYEIDEDGIWYQDTEGRCQSCGDWTPQRYKYYGMWVCETCYAEAENIDEYIEDGLNI